MAILNGLIRKMSGSTGDFTFKQLNGQTVVSEKVTQMRNPRSSAQMQTRTRFTNIVSMYRGIRPLINYGFETKAKGCSDYNMFVRVNMQQTPVYLTKQAVAGGACVAAPYQITQGSLPAIVVTGTGQNGVSDIRLGGESITTATTVAEFSQAVVENNADYKYGDQISFFLIKQKVNAETGIPYCQFSAAKVVLDAANNAQLVDVVSGSHGFASIDGKLGHSGNDGDCVYCWVHSRKSGNGKTLVSSQTLLAANSILASYQGDDAYTLASSSYGQSISAFLSPDGDVTGSTSGGDDGNNNGGGGGGNDTL
jgi:hypothetical protein